MLSLRTRADALRFLSIDAITKAKSGHPGMPLGMADLATVLWGSFLKHNPCNPQWVNRDRFVLSNGHGSALLYALLHLTGYDLSIEDVQNFRQLHSKTPGHPEYMHTPGVDTTTGPLGQGLANAVGMAIAEKILATQYHDPDITLIDHHTYAFVGDGCLMEGISHEACSLAGTLGLGKLIVLYDDNGISIDGPVQGWFTDDTAARFQAYHWQVIGPIDGHDPAAIENALQMARHNSVQPTLIICKTTIGLGSLLAGSAAVHGAPLTEEDIAQLRQQRQWPHPPFFIPDEIYNTWHHHAQGAQAEEMWRQQCAAYQLKHPEKYAEFLRRTQSEFPANWEDNTRDFIEQCQHRLGAMATRSSSQACLNYYAELLPEMLGGSADLTPSNNTYSSHSRAISHDDFSGNYLHYGVREFAMCAIMNGLALHRGFIPYGGTFLVFSDYAKGAIRLSALMKQRVIYVFTHDSIGLGEDGPTHQPIEQAAMLRLIPNVHVFRPADALEVAIAWKQALEHTTGPSCLLLSRQSLPVLPSDQRTSDVMQRGGYILYEPTQAPQVILIATGSEVHIALTCAQRMHQENIAVRVVSMPCAERFLAQDHAYQNMVLPDQIRHRIAIEAASSHYWYRFVGLDGCIIGLDRFGVSAPADDAYQFLHMTVERIIAAVHTLGENS